MYDKEKVGDLVPHRLNQEPIVLKGLSYTEILIAGIGGFVLGIFLCIPIAAILLGSAITGIGAALPFSICLVAVLGVILKKVKRNKPIGYLQVKFSIFRQKIGFKKRTFILDEKIYDTGRRQQK